MFEVELRCAVKGKTNGRKTDCQMDNLLERTSQLKVRQSMVFPVCCVEGGKTELGVLLRPRITVRSRLLMLQYTLNR
jgi:hypothetical protein